MRLFAIEGVEVAGESVLEAGDEAPNMRVPTQSARTVHTGTVPSQETAPVP